MIINELSDYLRSCNSQFWQKVFAAELAYLRQHLQLGDEILSVGCGPALIESGLNEYGFSVVGLDVSQDAIACSPDAVRTVVASAEKMPFSDSSFDVVLYIVSLQFIENYRQALLETMRVLRPEGKVIVMLLNPDSAFFQQKHAEDGSYVRNIRHTDVHVLELALEEGFEVQSEYFLGIADEQVFPSSEPKTASLYVMQGIKL